MIAVTEVKERRYRDVTDPPVDEEWRALHRRADAFTPKIMVAFEDSVDVLRNPSGERAADLSHSLARGDAFGALDALPWIEWGMALGNEVAAHVADLVTSAARVSATFLSRRTGITVIGKQQHEGELDLDFALVNDRAVQYAGLRSGVLIRELEPGTLQAVRAVIRRGALGELTVDQQASLIEDLVGLTERQVRAALRYIEALRRDGYSEAEIVRRRRQYAARLLRQRAENIARTETMRAANFGQRVLWEEAVQDGLLDARRVVQEWIAVVPSDGRTCPICVDLDGERVPLGGIFSTGTEQPPEHPSCRCALGLYETEEAA